VTVRFGVGVIPRQANQDKENCFEIFHNCN
jgi:hypothetical protein